MVKYSDLSDSTSFTKLQLRHMFYLTRQLMNCGVISVDVLQGYLVMILRVVLRANICLLWCSALIWFCCMTFSWMIITWISGHSRLNPFILPFCIECRRSLAMRILSVRPSVKRLGCNKTEERSVHIFIPYEIAFGLVLQEEEWLVWCDPFYLKFLVSGPLLERNCLSHIT